MFLSMNTRKNLAAVALGKRKADVIIQNGVLVNVHSKELLHQKEIAITDGCIAFIGDCSHLTGEETTVLDAKNRYITPGLMDGHMHVESTMLTVTEFAKAVIKEGTTSIFMDPHEIANVFGLEGVKWMHEEGQQLPLRVFTTVPSCVPSADTLEDAGAELLPQEIEESLQWKDVAGLGEVMNFPGVVHGEEKMMKEIEATIKAGKAVTGHIPADDPKLLQAYIASGVTSCHETVTREQAIEKVRLGMHLMIREGSAWQDVKQLAPVITEDQLPTENMSLITDDVYPQTLAADGHLNYVVRKAIQESVDPVTALQLATINVANYFGYGNQLGSLAPGKYADLLFIDDLEKVEPSTVMINGEIIFDEEKYQVDFPAYTYPEKAKQSVKVKEPLRPEDFLTRTTKHHTAKVNVIHALENNARTEKYKASLPVENGVIRPDVKQDITRLSCIERHYQSGEISNAFVHGFHINKGAVASTVAHDSHNLLVMGADEGDMAFAANEIIKRGGGMIVVENGKILAEVPLPIAGLMSDQPVEKVTEQVQELEKAWTELGCTLHAPFMTFSLIALPVIPSLRITNRGLADVDTFSLIPLEVD
ncbi:adenine deaminase [Halobacillus sp. Marseille-Q1614]|uniref:adenine deaminase n=1 Tax=Halobacillus sp. Marseille-Q1614 TaxID=2709134 RepID=UPI001570CE08|nr:adenine deaminase [Halobacillus sp. Marseille-Q1614]